MIHQSLYTAYINYITNLIKNKPLSFQINFLTKINIQFTILDFSCAVPLKFKEIKNIFLIFDIKNVESKVLEIVSSKFVVCVVERGMEEFEVVSKIRDMCIISVVDKNWYLNKY